MKSPIMPHHLAHNDFVRLVANDFEKKPNHQRTSPVASNHVRWVELSGRSHAKLPRCSTGARANLQSEDLLPSLPHWAWAAGRPEGSSATWLPYLLDLDTRRGGGVGTFCPWEILGGITTIGWSQETELSRWEAVMGVSDLRHDHSSALGFYKGISLGKSG